jgi:hypothetical protein
MISAAGVAEHAKVMVALVNEVAAVDADVTVVVVAVEMHVALLRIMSKSPTRTNFSSEEWERLGSMRSYVLQLREGGRGGRGRGDGNSNLHSTTNRSTNSVATGNNNSSDNNSNSNTNNVPTDQSVVSDITDRGSQNGRSFGRGAYNNNN